MRAGGPVHAKVDHVYQPAGIIRIRTLLKRRPLHVCPCALDMLSAQPCSAIPPSMLGKVKAKLR